MENNIPTKKRLISLALLKFDESKDGTGTNNFDLMADSIENLKSHLKNDLIRQGKKKIITSVEERIEWYRTIERKSSSYVSTYNGRMLNPMIDIKVNKVLTECREVLQKYAEEFGYL